MTVGGLAVLVSAQWLLLSAAIERFLGGEGALAPAFALASGACFAGVCWLVRAAGEA